jgi:hypothetical protein
MILPTKGIGADSALLAVSAQVLACLDEPKSVSRAWEEVRRRRVRPITFDWFVLALDLLFLVGVLSLEGGRLIRISTNGEPL